MVALSLFVVAASLSLSAPAAAQVAMSADFDRAASPQQILEGLRASAASMADAPMTAAPSPAPDTPILSSDTPPKLVKIFQNTFAKAIQRLRKPKCAALFGAPGEGERQFRAVQYSYRDLGKPTLNAEGMPRVVGAQTVSGSPAYVYINSEGPFVNQNVWTRDGWVVMDFETNLRGADFGGLLLLHELGHVVGKFGPDAHDQKLNRSYTDAVIKACYR